MVADHPDGGDVQMIKRRFDFWLILCVLVALVLAYLAAANRLQLDIDLPLFDRS